MNDLPPLFRLAMMCAMFAPGYLCMPLLFLFLQVMRFSLSSFLDSFRRLLR